MKSQAGACHTDAGRLSWRRQVQLGSSAESVRTGAGLGRATRRRGRPGRRRCARAAAPRGARSRSPARAAAASRPGARARTRRSAPTTPPPSPPPTAAAARARSSLARNPRRAAGLRLQRPHMARLKRSGFTAVSCAAEQLGHTAMRLRQAPVGVMQHRRASLQAPGQPSTAKRGREGSKLWGEAWAAARTQAHERVHLGQVVQQPQRRLAVHPVQPCCSAANHSIHTYVDICSSLTHFCPHMK